MYINKLKNDMAENEKRWEEVESLLGKEARLALEEYYARFDERLYLWLADLYDPKRGGFYCTVAARDSEGYLPDIQSTAQVLAFLDNSGMTRAYGGWQYALPERISDAIAEFAKGLQSSVDGYIYHPQWEGMKYTDSRLGRDAVWLGEILRPLYRRYAEQYRSEGYTEKEVGELLKKYMPYWDAPTGQKGSLGAPERGSAKAKVPTSKWTPQLRSLDAWRAYLYGGNVGDDSFEGLDLAADSYTVGNRFNAQMTQIIQRDAEAAANGEPTGYAALTKEFLDRGANAANGLFEKDVKYNSVNGLMKIITVYNAMHWALPYPERAMESAIAVARLDALDIDGKGAVAAVDVYNPWVAISAIFINVESYNDSIEYEAFNKKWRSEIKKNAADMIRGTGEKISKFAKCDGSYGYHWGAPSVHAQGMPVTVPGVVCGDVDGGCISSTGTLGRICATLGIKDIAPSLFTSDDLERFVKRIEEKL